MKNPNLAKRIGAVLAAITLTAAGAWYAADRAKLNVLQTSGSAGERQFIILDAGHGASA
ncbi:MAG: hypothetical protein K5695_10335 [Oscillospiraceae bacterium]|nr:hypothetical protein [Oscillospiraceae bacterium]